MDSIVFVLILFVTTVTRTTTLTIEVASDNVTVREGEQLSLSCSLMLDGQGITEVRWYRDTMTPYGSIDVINCGALFLCPEVNTTDNRGVVQYTRGFSNAATLTLVIDHSLPRDNTRFSCGVIKTNGISQSADSLISVTVQHLPDPTYPMCLIRSNSSTPTDSLSLSCLAEQTLPVVSLEWTVEGISYDRISFRNKTEIVENQVENNLFINETVVPGSLVFTCHMTSSAFPHTQRNCSVGLNLTLGDQITEGILPDATTTTRLAQDGTPTPTASDITTQNDLTLNTTVIAAIASASVVIIVILLIVIACLVSSRRRRSRAASKDPQDLGMRLSVSITSPGSNSNLFHEAHVYANQSNPAISFLKPTNQQPGSFELQPRDTTAAPPSPLYAEASSGKKVPHIQAGDSSYAVVSKQGKRRQSTPHEEDKPNLGHQSQDPLEYYQLEPGARQLTQGQLPESTEDQGAYDVPRPGQGVRSQGSSKLDEDDWKLVDNILYTSNCNEYM